MQNTLKRIAFLPAHPSQLWLMHALESELSQFAEIIWVLREKDGLTKIADHLGIKYVSFTKASSGLIGNALELIHGIFTALKITRNYKIDIWFTKYGAGNIAAWLSNKISISFNDDDADIVPLIAWTSYPFSKLILAPCVTRMGRFKSKTHCYNGYHELFYLHPNHFTPDKNIYTELGIIENKPYAVIRLSGLDAHHDIGIRGMDEAYVKSIITIFDKSGLAVFITSEKFVSKALEKYRIPLQPHRIHHALAYADMLVSDSQTMSAEAAVLGTLALRINDFAGKISYINDLESYGLIESFLPEQGNQLKERLYELLKNSDRKTKYIKIRDNLLKEKIDPVPFFINEIKNNLHDNL